LASTQMFLLQNNYIPTDNRQQEERKVNWNIMHHVAYKVELSPILNDFCDIH
jgi:hypothetical protein